MIDWHKLAVLGAQCVVVAVLGVLVLCGHNSAVTDGLLAVSGSITGIGVYQTVRKQAD